MTNSELFLGVLMLDTAFPRVPGDAGNATSYPCPVKIKRVKCAGALDVVSATGPSDALPERFFTAASELEAQGAVALVSTCGFLVHRQTEIACAVTIPTMVSSLSLFPTLRSTVGGRPVGILTASRSDLVNGTLKAAGILQADVRVAGFEDCAAFSNAILAHKADQPDKLDTAVIKAFAVAQARALVDATPDLGAILLECGNLPPYADAIRTEVQRRFSRSWTL